MSFPDSCLRGVRKQNDMTPEGGVASTVFLPDSRTAANRADGGQELSINWEDDTTVLDFTLQFKVAGQYQFPQGVVQLPRQEIDRINTLPTAKNALSYERAPLADNPYHGNLVFRSDLSKQMINMIAATIALACTKVIRRS